jgi:hypothetical protein
MESKLVLHADHDSMLQVHTPSKATQFSKLCYTHTNKRLYLNPAMRRDYLSLRRIGSTSNSSCAVSTHRSAARALHQPRRTSRCLSSSRGSSSTTSPTSRVRIPRHVARLVTGPSSTTSPTSRVPVPRHVARLVTRLVVDYLAYVVPPGASARHAARCRLLRLRRASRCLGTSRGSSRASSSTTWPTLCVRVPRHVARLVVDFFTYAARPGASARRAARHADRRAARRRQLHLAQARHRLLRLCCASGCLGTSRGSRLVVPLVVDYSASRRLVVDYSASRRLVVDYFASAARPGASARRAARHADRRAARRRLLRLRRASGCLGTSRGSLLVVDYFAYAA